jgi:hypothetical protein
MDNKKIKIIISAAAFVLIIFAIIFVFKIYNQKSSKITPTFYFPSYSPTETSKNIGTLEDFGIPQKIFVRIERIEKVPQDFSSKVRYVIMASELDENFNQVPVINPRQILITDDTEITGTGIYENIKNISDLKKGFIIEVIGNKRFYLTSNEIVNKVYPAAKINVLPLLR